MNVTCSSGCSIVADLHCRFPDIVEQLVANHMQKDDTMSALITAEWMMRKQHFPGWGRPFEYNARLYKHIGRAEEARDSVGASAWLLWSSLQASVSPQHPVC